MKRGYYAGGSGGYGGGLHNQRGSGRGAGKKQRHWELISNITSDYYSFIALFRCLINGLNYDFKILTFKIFTWMAHLFLWWNCKDIIKPYLVNNENFNGSLQLYFDFIHFTLGWINKLCWRLCHWTFVSPTLNYYNINDNEIRSTKEMVLFLWAIKYIWNFESLFCYLYVYLDIPATYNLLIIN